jgi:hypothetical protein
MQWLWYNQRYQSTVPATASTVRGLTHDGVITMSTPDSTTPPKCCNVCGKPYPPTSEFWHKNKAEKDGLCRTCRTCARARARQWGRDNQEYANARAKDYYLANKEHIKARVKTYAEDHVEEIKANKVIYHQDHKEEHNAKNRANRLINLERETRRVITWVAEHPDQRRAIANRYGKTPKGIAARLRRRARERDLPDTFTALEWEFCLMWWHDSCAYCGEQRRLSADHFIPLADLDRCPGTVAENMLPSCKRCNSSKQHRDPAEWLATRYPEPEYLEILARIAAYFDIL